MAQNMVVNAPCALEKKCFADVGWYDYQRGQVD